MFARFSKCPLCPGRDKIAIGSAQSASEPIRAKGVTSRSELLRFCRRADEGKWPVGSFGVRRLDAALDGGRPHYPKRRRAAALQNGPVQAFFIGRLVGAPRFNEGARRLLSPRIP